MFPPDRSGTNAAAADRLRTFAGDSDIVWLVENGDAGLIPAWYQDILAQDYAAARIVRDGDALAYAFTTATRYVRIPDDVRDHFVFQDADSGSRLVLKVWTLLNAVEVQPCQPVRLRSWWQVGSSVDVCLTLAIVDGATGQGTANTDGPPLGEQSSALRPDRLYADERTVTVPCDAAPGEYPLMLGFYRVRDSTIVPLAASLPDGTPLDDLVYFKFWV